MQPEYHFEGWAVPADFYSDGCTFPGPLKHFKRLMKAAKMRPACRLHDFHVRHLRLYGMASWQAHLIFWRYLHHLGADHVRAATYWVFVSIGGLIYRSTEPLPDHWLPYRYPTFK